MVGRGFLFSRIRGSMLGSLAGDCLGHPFETSGSTVSRIVLEKYLIGLQDPNLKVPYKAYTDDTSMSRCVAKSLLECKGYNPRDLAHKFVDEYRSDPKREYGKNIVTVFVKMDSQGYEHPYRPAMEQFEGRGSYGNGAAMRVAPVALYFWDDLNRCLEVAKDQSKLTHYNWIAIFGAVLQCSAVFHALNCDSDRKLDPIEYLSKIRESLEQVASKEESTESLTENLDCYRAKLDKLQGFLGKPNPTPDHIKAELGNGVSALDSVPTAIYSFLRSVKDTDCLKDAMFCQTLFNAILVGGDTDTIAAMSGAICGAYVGVENINETLAAHLEDREGILELADRIVEGISK